ncbi:MAG TPA: serine hydrolase domain-containing protein [Terriglobales bacterium]|nr:serine hydrolase domain-containing protein [Terriglobales bacterium]
MASILRYSLLQMVSVFLLAGSILSQDGSKVTLDPQRLQNIQSRMQEFVDKGLSAGAVTMVLQDGKTVQSAVVGMQNIEEHKPMKQDTIFQIMSMTKPFTGVGIMMLAEEGKISLYDNVETYLPEFHNQPLNVNGWMRKPSRPVRICDLLSHTSGMRNEPQGATRDLYRTMDLTLAQAVKEYAKEPLEFEPGTKWLYSNPGIATLGRIIEVVSGQSFESFIQTRLLDPLQMKDTFFYPPADKISRIAMVYMPQNGKFVREGADILGGDPATYRKGAKYPAPEFGLFSTAEDISHFCQMILDKGTWKGKRFLSPVSIETMREPQTLGMQPGGWYPGADYGLIWEIVNRPLGVVGFLPKGSFGHGGAFGTHEWIIPSRGMITIFMTACEGDCSDLPEHGFQEMVAASVQ